ncbi:MAG: hypothetical protein ACPGXL_05775 [Chitinophagales bacterium]
MNKINILFAVIIFLGVNIAASAGGPWTQKQGKGYFKLSEWWTVFDQHFTDTGEIDPNVTTGVFNTTLYAEYGITDQFTAILNAPFLSRNYMNNLRSATTNEIIVAGEAINTVGDIDVGIRYGINNTPIPVAVSLLLGIPSGTPVAGTLDNLQTGDGEFNQILQVDAGTGFSIGKYNAYTSGYVGLNNRTNGFSDEFRYGVELGINLLKEKLWLTSRINAVESFKNGETAATVTSTSLFANNAEFVGIGIEANYYITPKVGVSASTAGAFRGEIIAARPSYSVGVFLDLSK